MRLRTQLFGLLFLIQATALAAERDSLGFMAAGGAPQKSSIDSFYRYEPGSSTPESGAAPIMTEQQVRGRFVVARNATDTWSVLQSVGHLNLTESPTVAETGLQIPNSLWDVETGAGYNHQMGGRRAWGANLNVGSASDKPYNSIHETLIRVNANYRLPSGDTNAWLFFLGYSNNRHFLNNIPLPGFAYMWNHPAQHFIAMAGFPFGALWWRPDPWSFRASLFGPSNLSAEAARRIAGPVKAYTAFDWGQQEWLRANRNDNSNRIFLNEKRTTVGLRSPIAKALEADLSGGWAFDRRFYENRSSSTNDVPVASLRNSWFFEARLNWRLGHAPTVREE